VVTRRALFGAGALALLAGCGPEEEPKVDVKAVLAEQHEVLSTVYDSYEGVPMAGALQANAQARALQVGTALERFGGKQRGVLRVVEGGKTADAALQAALAAESEALRAHVAAVGQLKAAEYRELLAGLITDAAANQSTLLIRLGRPPLPTAFPGEPV
jgi:hypothetical protein